MSRLGSGLKRHVRRWDLDFKSSETEEEYTKQAYGRAYRKATHAYQVWFIIATTLFFVRTTQTAYRRRVQEDVAVLVSTLSHIFIIMLSGSLWTILASSRF